MEQMSCYGVDRLGDRHIQVCQDGIGYMGICGSS